MSKLQVSLREGVDIKSPLKKGAFAAAGKRFERFTAERMSALSPIPTSVPFMGKPWPVL